MKFGVVLLAVSMCLLGCGPKTGLSSDESEEQSKQWGQEAYEEAMIKAGKGDELKAEKDKWAESQVGQREGQEQAPGGPAAGS